MKTTKLLAAFALTLASFISFGQSPEGFKYQAVVRDAGNLILTNQAVGVQLIIQQGNIGGIAVYTETFAPTTNAYGLVNLEIGSGTTADDFSLIDWSNGPYFIETSIDVTGGIAYSVMGTSQLMSVPYALYAKTAENATNDLVDDADADPTNELQAVSFSNDTLYLSNGGNVYLGNYAINTQIDSTGITTLGFVAGPHTVDTDDQTISLTGTDLTIIDGNTVDLSSIDTDDQTLSLSGTDLTIVDGNTVDISSVQDISTLQDADGDTKIQVEESADEDKIRFDLDGTEYFRMEEGRFQTQNSGLSVIIGQNAGLNDDFTNNENVYIGYLTGVGNVNSAGNIGIGRASQENHTSGNFSTSIGNYSLQKHESGANNVTIGAYSMNNNVDGTDNTAMGIGALRYDTTGSSNVAVGAFSLYNGLDLSGNTSVGHYSGYSASGDNNVFLGKSAGRNSSEDNSLYIDNTNTSSPLVYGQFDNDLLRVNGTLNSTGAITGDATIDIASTGLIGNMSLGSESTDQGTSIATGLGYTTTPWLYTNAIEAQGERGTGSTLITLGADGTYGAADEVHFVTSGNSQMRIASDGKVGFDKDPDTDLHIRQSQQSITNGTGGIKFEDGSNAADYWRIYHSGIYFSFNLQGSRVAYVNTTGAWTIDSDRRLKYDIKPLKSVLDRVMQLKPVDYLYNEQEPTENKVIGLVAQEVQPLFPEIVVQSEEDKLGITYGATGVIAIKAIQEQQEIIEEQEMEIEVLQQQMMLLMNEVKSLKEAQK